MLWVQCTRTKPQYIYIMMQDRETRLTFMLEIKEIINMSKLNMKNATNLAKNFKIMRQLGFCNCSKA